MAEIFLSELANTHSKWLSAKQSIIASNIANANTPGYRALDVQPMGSPEKTFSNLVQTDDRHIASGIGNVAGVGTKQDESWEAYHSGANVSLPQEMMKAGEVFTAYELNTSVMKSFHRMVIAVFGT